MNGSYVLGVDGGNSKTDYFLFDVKGHFIDHLHKGTCSHERFADGYASTYRIMKDHIDILLTRNHLSIQQLATAAFGLAGADTITQKKQLSRVIQRIGLQQYTVDNDSFLGVKAGSMKGYGVCSINGSGTSTGGISPSGKRLQVGGVGSELTGDEAGGFYMARQVLRAVYDNFYRMGPETIMVLPVMQLLQIPNKESFIEYALDGVLRHTLPNTALIQILFAAANQGDCPAVHIIDNSAKQIAQSTVGCIHNLDFETEVDIILAGSVWIKAETPLLFEKYQMYVNQLTDHSCRFIHLQVPPATGAVLWALELAHGQPVQDAIRNSVIQSVIEPLHK